MKIVPKSLITTSLAFALSTNVAYADTPQAPNTPATKPQTLVSPAQTLTMDEVAKRILDAQLSMHPDLTIETLDKNYSFATALLLSSVEQAQLELSTNPNALNPGDLYLRILKDIEDYKVKSQTDSELNISTNVNKQSSIVEYVYNDIHNKHLIRKPLRFFPEQFIAAVLRHAKTEGAVDKIVATALHKTVNQYGPNTQYLGYNDTVEKIDNDKGIAVRGGIGALVALDFELTQQEIETGHTPKLKVGLRVDKLTSLDAPAAMQGIKSGDLITHINDVSLSGLTLNQAVGHIVGDVGTTIKISVDRNGKLEEFIEVPRAIIEKSPVEFEMLQDNVGYIYMGIFNDKSSNDINAAARDLRAQGAERFILDLRDNPGGATAQADGVLESLIDGDNLDLTKLDNPSQMSADERAAFDRNVTIRMKTNTGSARETYYVTPGATITEPVAVLINGNSASSAEIVAGVLQNYNRATIVGSQSYGKGVGQDTSTIDVDADGVPEGQYSRTDFYYYIGKGDGYSIHTKGVTPNIGVYDSFNAQAAPRGAHPLGHIPYPSDSIHPGTKPEAKCYPLNTANQPIDLDIACGMEALGIDIEEITISPQLK